MVDIYRDVQFFLKYTCINNCPNIYRFKRWFNCPKSNKI